MQDALFAAAQQGQQELEQVHEVDEQAQRPKTGGHSHRRLIPAQRVVGHLQPLGVIGDQGREDQQGQTEVKGQPPVLRWQALAHVLLLSNEFLHLR